MSEPENSNPLELPNREPATLFDSLADKSGDRVLLDIVKDVPAADPAVAEMRTAERTGERGTPSTTATSENPNETPVLEVDPKAYTYVQDHKGNPFDPEKHQVDEKGNPVFNARGRVKKLESGTENPVRLIFNNLKNIVIPEVERPQAECVAQAVAQSVEGERKESAEIMVDLYGGAGYVLRGAPFRKNWEKARRGKLVASLIRYQRLKNIVIPVKAEWILFHAFGTDLLTVEGETLFEKKGGLMAFMGRKGWNKRAEALVKRVETDAAPEAVAS